METKSEPRMVGKTCTCCGKFITETYVWAETDMGLWYNCGGGLLDGCGSTGLAKPNHDALTAIVEYLHREELPVVEMQNLKLINLTRSK